MEFELQRLHPSMLERYEIADRRPGHVNVIEFGMSEAMLGTVNRLLDDAPRGPGVVCVEAEETGLARRLEEQGGLYTLVIRGYEGDDPVRREQVIQRVVRACEAREAESLAGEAGLECGFVDDSDAARALAARFVEQRAAAGLEAMPLFYLGQNALADSLAFRSEPDEAARLCREMNYRDDMLYLAEPYARLTLDAPEALRERLCLDGVPGIRFDDPDAGRLKAGVFDAGLFLMAAPGWLLGCDTLRDCMNHPRLRKFVGEGFTEEVMPALVALDRAAVERCVIESFARYEDPLNRNRVLRAAHHLIGRFVQGPLDSLRRLAGADFEPPRRLSFALAATVMLYAGARPDPATGQYTVARGKTAETLHDDDAILKTFSTLAHDMPPESLAYAALADRELWGGADLRQIDGLEERVALDIANIQRQPDYLPE